MLKPASKQHNGLKFAGVKVYHHSSVEIYVFLSFSRSRHLVLLADRRLLVLQLPEKAQSFADAIIEETMVVEYNMLSVEKQGETTFALHPKDKQSLVFECKNATNWVAQVSNLL